MGNCFHFLTSSPNYFNKYYKKCMEISQDNLYVNMGAYRVKKRKMCLIRSDRREIISSFICNF